MLDTLEDWNKPKSDEIAVFTYLRALNQGNKTLSAYIQEVRRVVVLCNFTCVGGCKDRLIRNFIVAGLSSTKVYQQCISKGSSFSLSECIKICQTEDATCSQVQALCLESTDCGDSTSIHKLTKYPQQQGRPSYRGRGASGVAGPVTGVAKPQGPGPRGKNTDTVLRLHANSVVQTLTSSGKSVEP